MGSRLLNGSLQLITKMTVLSLTAVILVTVILGTLPGIPVMNI